MKNEFTSCFAWVGTWSIFTRLKEENRLRVFDTLLQSPSDFLFKVEVMIFVEKQNWVS
jgi:hypothetical protein